MSFFNCSSRGQGRTPSLNGLPVCIDGIPTEHCQMFSGALSASIPTTQHVVVWVHSQIFLWLVV